jgi:hypothetical protein
VLEEATELRVTVAEFDEPVELHLLDTEIGDGSVLLELSDGTALFDVDTVSGRGGIHTPLRTSRESGQTAPGECPHGLRFGRPTHIDQ